MLWDKVDIRLYKHSVSHKDVSHLGDVEWDLQGVITQAKVTAPIHERRICKFCSI